MSGGPDSLALLVLARTAGLDIEVATVDHRLRAHSADECAQVAALCAEWAIPCEVLAVALAPGNVQAAARAARYAALAEWAGRRELSAVATAHHADDQAETLLLRLERGSGVAGLAGVRPRSVIGRDMPLVRPLLSWRKAELARITEEAGLQAVADPSNQDLRFARARVRRFLAHSPLLDPRAMAQSAAHLAEADEALEWAARREWDERVTCEGRRARYRPLAPQAIALRVIRRVIVQLGGEPRGADVARLFERLRRGESGNVAGVLAQVRRGEWVFVPEPARRTGGSVAAAPEGD